MPASHRLPQLRPWMRIDRLVPVIGSESLASSRRPLPPFSARAARHSIARHTGGAAAGASRVVRRAATLARPRGGDDAGSSRRGTRTGAGAPARDARAGAREEGDRCGRRARTLAISRRSRHGCARGADRQRDSRWNTGSRCAGAVCVRLRRTLALPAGGGGNNEAGTVLLSCRGRCRLLCPSLERERNPHPTLPLQGRDEDAAT